MTKSLNVFAITLTVSAVVMGAGLALLLLLSFVSLNSWAPGDTDHAWWESSQFSAVLVAGIGVAGVAAVVSLIGAIVSDVIGRSKRRNRKLGPAPGDARDPNENWPY